MPLINEAGLTVNIQPQGGKTMGAFKLLRTVKPEDYKGNGEIIKSLMNESDKEGQAGQVEGACKYKVAYTIPGFDARSVIEHEDEKHRQEDMEEGADLRLRRVVAPMFAAGKTGAEVEAACESRDWNAEVVRSKKDPDEIYCRTVLAGQPDAIAQAVSMGWGKAALVIKKKLEKVRITL